MVVGLLCKFLLWECLAGVWMLSVSVCFKFCYDFGGFGCSVCVFRVVLCLGLGFKSCGFAWWGGVIWYLWVVHRLNCCSCELLLVCGVIVV